MNEEKRKIFFSLIKSAVLGIALTDDEKADFSYEMLPEFYSLSKKHTVAHLIAVGLETNGLMCKGNEFCEKFQKQKFSAFFRQEKINYHFEKQCEVLEKAKIPFVPLKGAVIKELYPESWMRTSSDIDILVKEKDLKKAENALKEQLSYTGEEKGHYHNVSLFSDDGVHLELHFSIKEAMKNIDSLLQKVWDYTEKSESKEFEFRQTNKFLMFHIIAHMYYHFLSGGCGIKAFVDLMLLNEKLAFNRVEILRMCTQCEIGKFYGAVLNLLDVWFNDGEHNELTLFMEDFIFKGGVFGNTTSVAQIKSARKNGRLGYVLEKVFLPIELMQTLFPILKKHIWLLPFCHIVRWVKQLFSGGIEKTRKSIKSGQKVTDDELKKTVEFLKQLDIV